MPRNSIRSRTVTFMAVQSIILGVIMLAFVVLTSVLFVKNAVRWQMGKVEQGVMMFAQQAAHASEIPKRGDLGEFSFFILNLEGKYILPRLPRADESEKMWQEYELKLLYEMQKRRDGWIYYPDQGLGMQDGRYVIRYLFLEKQGWIVAAESYLPGAWSMLKGFLTPKLFLGLFFVVGLAFALMLLNAFWHFRKMMKAILRSQENNFIAAAGHAKPSSEPLFNKPEEKSLDGGVIRNLPEQALPRMRPERGAGPEEENRTAARVSPFAEKPAGNIPVETKAAATVSSRQMDVLGEVTLDTGDIRSPLLKQVIQEMRDQGK